SGYPTDKVTIESRWAEGRPEQLPKLAAELVALNVAAIVGGNVEAVRAAKEGTKIIPIIFVSGLDPIEIGLFSSLNRRGGNVTGVSFYDVPVLGKRLALLRFSAIRSQTRSVTARAHADGCRSAFQFGCTSASRPPHLPHFTGCR